nr:MAG TPA: pentapeptide repeat protein [Caudoviricetes sp.]
MTEKELKEILGRHRKWLSKEEGGEMADLGDANLFGADLRGADLGGANLCGADLGGANLSGADLCDANLRGADLRGADLCDANLCDANLSDADLCDANLSNADLRHANLCDVKYNEKTAFFALTCPEEGAFIGFKKAGGKIVKLLIPEDAKRSSATSRKCRCSKAIVLSITNLDGSDEGDKGVKSNHQKDFIYKVGKTLEVKDFDENRWNECSTGIHFFITRDEAVNYN